MTERDKIAHLLRRFGLGAGKYELDRYAKLGLAGAITQLIDYHKTEDLPLSPWEFSFDEKGNPNLGAPTFTNYWSFRLLTSNRPLEERLALFWHDHFAVSANKVEFGPMMLTYLQTIYQHAAGDYRAFVHAMAKDPAMIEWLDLNSNNRFAPNENFAREVMELFTMGSGYAETDIKEAARALTGWSAIPTFIDQKKGPYEEQIKASILNGTPLVLFITIPYLHDDGQKTILGEKGAFDGDAALDIMIRRPETARFITTKLWEWFAYARPAASIIDRLAGIFTKSNYQIRPVLRAIAESPEFYSEAHVRNKVKSPMDFIVPIIRQFDLRAAFLGFRKPGTKLNTPIPKEIAGASGYVTSTMMNQGLFLLYPPDVGGWHWDETWLNSTAMTERISSAELLIGNAKEQRPLTDYFAKKIQKDFAPKNSAEVAHALTEIFDAQLTAKQLQTLAESCEKHGGSEALGSTKSAAAMLGPAMQLLFAAPEFHLY